MTIPPGGADYPTKLKIGALGHPSTLAWGFIARSPGNYVFTSGVNSGSGGFDGYVNAAVQNGLVDSNGVAEVTITFGYTPMWAAADTSRCKMVGPAPVCPSPPANITDWTDFVTAVINHYNGKTAPHVKYYELWNEFSSPSFWTGTMQDMVKLASTAYPIIHTDPYSSLLTPSVSGPVGTSAPNGLPDGLAWMTSYLQAGGNMYADGGTFHGYVARFGGENITLFPWPEQDSTSGCSPGLPCFGSIIAKTTGFRQVFDQNGLIGKPVLDTEGSWGKNGNLSNPSQGAAWMARWYILQASYYPGITQAAWYAWGYPSEAGQLQSDSAGTLNATGVAYNQVYDWLVGASFGSPCASDSNSTWTCPITRSGGYQGLVIWNAMGSSRYTPASTYRQLRDLAGNTTRLSGGTITVGLEPVLLENLASTLGVLTPTNLTFSTQILNTSSAAQNIMVTNSGTASMAINNIAITGANSSDFSQSNTCGSSLAAGASCAISVTFSPTAAGTLTATVTITENGGSQNVALSGSAQGLIQVPGNVAQIQVGGNGAVFAINSSQQIYSYDFQTQSWVLLPGRLVQLAVGADGSLWGVNSAHQSFSYDSTNNTWIPISGAALNEVAVGYIDVAWGLNSSGQVYRYDPGTKRWDLIPGALMQLAIGPDGAAWGVNPSNSVYYFNPRTQKWDQIGGPLLTQVAVGYGGVVWGVNADNRQIYQFSRATQAFALVPGARTQVAVGRDGTVWAVDAGQPDAYRYNPSAPGSWDVFPMSAPISQVSVGYAGAVWAVDSSDNTYELQPSTRAPVKRLHQVAGELVGVAVAVDGDVWGVNSSGKIYTFNSATQTWDIVASGPTQIAVGFGGAVWGLDSQQQIYKFNPHTQNWTLIPGLLTQVAVGSANAVWGINASDQVYQYSDNQWYLRAGLTAVQIAVAPDGTVWGVNAQQQIYSYNSQIRSWQQALGLLKQVAVGSATVIWGINSSQNIYNYNTEREAWDLIPGELKQLGVGPDGVPWGLNDSGTVHEYDVRSGHWNRINGTTLSAIAVGADEAVWGLNGNLIYRVH
ncbi:MAG TPA: tectonin domain-containing protein [Terriglobia bacterium]